MNEETKFYSQTLWSYIDSSISSFTFKVETLISKDEWGVSPLRLKFIINNIKNRSNESIYLDYSKIFELLSSIKPITDNLSSVLQKVSTNQNHQEYITISTGSGKKKLIISFLYRTEYNGPCVRLIISDRNENFLDSEKVYMGYIEFLSVLRLLVNYRDTYIASSSNAVSVIYLDEVKEKIFDLSKKIDNFYMEIISKRKKPDEPIPVNNTDVLGPEPLQRKEEPALPVAEEIINPLQDSLGDFLKTKKDELSLDLPKDFDVERTTPVLKTEVKSFTNEVLNNSCLNLEMYLGNVAGEILPFDKFTNLISTKLGVDMYDGLEGSEISALNYYVSCSVKQVTQKCLQSKTLFPKTISPIMFSKMKIDEDRINLAYEFLCYILYYNQLKNILVEKSNNSVKNKDYITFVIKSILTSYVISIINNVDINVSSKEVSKKYNELKDKGVFKTLEEQVKLEFSIVPDITNTLIEAEVQRIAESAKKWKSELTFEKKFLEFNNQNILLLEYGKIKDKNLSIEQIKKIVSLELNFRQNGKVLFEQIVEKDFSDIPIDISEKYNVQTIKYNNENLKRFLVENEKDQELINQVCSVINQSFRDAKDKTIDLNRLSDLSLKSLFLWDINRDPRISTDYFYFKQLIEQCSLTRDVLISLLINIQDVMNIDVVRQFLAAREE